MRPFTAAVPPRAWSEPVSASGTSSATSATSSGSLIGRSPAHSPRRRDRDGRRGRGRFPTRSRRYRSRRHGRRYGRRPPRRRAGRACCRRGACRFPPARDTLPRSARACRRSLPVPPVSGQSGCHDRPGCPAPRAAFDSFSMRPLGVTMARPLRRTTRRAPSGAQAASLAPGRSCAPLEPSGRSVQRSSLRENLQTIALTKEMVRSSGDHSG